MKKVLNWFKTTYNTIRYFLYYKFLGVKNFFVRQYRGVTNYFHNKHVALLTGIIQFLLFHTSKYMVKLLLLNGKDPNYVAPPPPPPPEPEKPRKVLQIPYVPAWVAPSFKDKTKHPLYNEAYKTVTKPQPSELQVVLSEHNKSLLEPVLVSASRGSLSDLIKKE
jgi:hypothetical protein